MGSHSFTMTRVSEADLEDAAIELWSEWVWRVGLQDSPPDYDPDRWLPIAAELAQAAADYRADMREDDRWLEGWEREAAE